MVITPPPAPFPQGSLCGATGESQGGAASDGGKREPSPANGTWWRCDISLSNYNGCCPLPTLQGSNSDQGVDLQMDREPHYAAGWRIYAHSPTTMQWSLKIKKVY